MIIIGKNWLDNLHFYSSFLEFSQGNKINQENKVKNSDKQVRIERKREKERESAIKSINCFVEFRNTSISISLHLLSVCAF